MQGFTILRSARFSIVKYFRKYILRTFSASLRIVLIRLYLLGVYTLSYHTRYHRGLREVERSSRISFRVSKWSLFLQTRSEENVFSHSESIDLRVRFEIRYRSGYALACEGSTSREDLSVLAKRAHNFASRRLRPEKIRREIRASTIILAIPPTILSRVTDLWEANVLYKKRFKLEKTLKVKLSLKYNFKNVIILIILIKLIILIILVILVILLILLILTILLKSCD